MGGETPPLNNGDVDASMLNCGRKLQNDNNHEIFFPSNRNWWAQNQMKVVIKAAKIWYDDGNETLLLWSALVRYYLIAFHALSQSPQPQQPASSSCITLHCNTSSPACSSLRGRCHFFILMCLLCLPLHLQLDTTARQCQRQAINSTASWLSESPVAYVVWSLTGLNTSAVVVVVTPCTCIPKYVCKSAAA